MRARVAALLTALLLGACDVGSGPTASPPATPADSTASASTGASTARTPAPRTVEVRYRVERRTDDAGTAGFPEVVRSTLEDPRGWERAGFDLVHDADAPHVVVLAEGPEVDELCFPYDTQGLYSCQNGPVVALNADRWRTATPRWTGDLQTYRRYLINHEFGHLLGLHHPAPQCPAHGLPAAVMAQQSTELEGCRPNGWPLDWEIELASRHELPIAPPYDPDPTPRPNDPRAPLTDPSP